MTEGPGTTVYWIIDGENVGIGYFHKWAIPVPGDHVLMRDHKALGAPREDYTVEVTHRTFSQPEQDHPWIRIHARKIQSGTDIAGVADAAVTLDSMTPDQRNNMVEAVRQWLAAAGYRFVPPEDGR